MAGGADSYGYLSQARLWAHGTPASRPADHDGRLVAVLGPGALASGLSAGAAWTGHRAGVCAGPADGDGGVRSGCRIRGRFLRGSPAWWGRGVGDVFDRHGGRRSVGRSHRRRAAGDEPGLSLSAHVPDERRPRHGVVGVVSRTAAVQATRCRARRRSVRGDRDPHPPQPGADPVRPGHLPALGRGQRSGPPRPGHAASVVVRQRHHPRVPGGRLSQREVVRRGPA